MSAFDDLIGQDGVVADLRAAATAARDALAGGPGTGMTHAWLFTGPPGSGRSVAARAFAAALQCEAEGEPGCGRCAGCRQVLAGAHPDVESVRPEGLSLGVREARGLVARSALTPMGQRWQILLVEDADRLTEGAANVLLKAIEEPAARTVWLLCVPSAADLVVTIRSRCRVVALTAPPTSAVADVLVRRDGVDLRRADIAARAAFGHVGRARRLALDPDARTRRERSLRLASVGSVGECLAAAAALVEAASEEASALTRPLDEAEVAALKEGYGEGATTTGGAKATRAAAREQAAALKELEARQKSRATRAQRDALDRALTDVAGFYRDVLVVQLGAGVDLANLDVEKSVREAAATSSPEATLRRIDAVLECRTLLDANANPLLAVEAMTLALLS